MLRGEDKKKHSIEQLLNSFGQKSWKYTGKKEIKNGNRKGKKQKSKQQ